MGGTKRKIKIEKIEKKTVKAVAFTKRRDGLFRKASELCRLSPATQITILATPPSSNSHASFYSFGHSSVDHVVSSLLNDQPPLPPATNQEGFWWEDQDLQRLENVDELKDATEAVTRMLNNVRLRLDDVKSNQRDGALVIHQVEELPQLSNNNNEDMSNQIHKFEGALVENDEDILHVDDFFSDVEIDPI